MAYDMCALVPPAELAKAVEVAKALGWKGMCVFAGKKEVAGLKEATKPIKGFDVAVGLLYEPRSRNDLRKHVQSDRKNYEAVAVRSANPEIIRAASETRGVDLVAGWESGESGLDYITAKLAAENGVGIAFSMQPLLDAYDRSRAAVMSKMAEAARFVRKYRTSFVLASGAISAWDLRSPSELAAFGSVLGLDGRETRRALSGRMLAENRKRLSGKWIMPGVEIE